MSITTANDVGRLFSLAFGEEWVEAGMMSRASDELKSVEKLALNHVDNALIQLESLGRVLGGADAKDVDVNTLGWAITAIAENASFCMAMADSAHALLNPEYRRTFKMPALMA